MEEAKVLDDKRYSPRELRLILSEKRGKPLSDPTWARWKRNFGMKPDANGEYSKEDKKLLEGLVEAIKAGWSIKRYQEKLEEEVNNAERIHRQNQQQEPIEVSATAC